MSLFPFKVLTLLTQIQPTAFPGKNYSKLAGELEQLIQKTQVDSSLARPVDSFKESILLQKNTDQAMTAGTFETPWPKIPRFNSQSV